MNEYNHPHSDWTNMIRIAPTDEGYRLERTDWRTGKKEAIYYSNVKEIAKVIDPAEKNGNSIREILVADEPPIAC